MDSGKLTTLKDKLITGTNFSNTMRWFFDEIAETSDFASLGEPTSDKLLMEALSGVIAQIIGQNQAAAVEALLFRVPEHQFIHGALTVGKQLGSVFYFEDIERGLLALGDLTGPTHFVRFSFIQTPNGRSFTLN